ncbi:MAG: hypothetical protein II723_07590 [Oscillospiraceae bacterium]|nr:hypothetical protein [Oscillospiraceae bacterium]
MKTVVITRKKQFAAALVSYWIVRADLAESMPERFQTVSQARLGLTGHPRPTLHIALLKDIGIPVGNGETVRIELPDEVQGIYVVTMDGVRSDCAALTGDHAEFRFRIVTKGGFLRPAYPVIEQESAGVLSD